MSASMLDPAIDPMQDPVAQPGRICATCRWWGPNFGPFGDCGHPGQMARIMVENGLSRLQTRGEFGCNQWRAKEIVR